MKAVFRWLLKIVASALTTVLIIVLLPHASKWMSAILPDLSGAAVNASVLLSHEMQNSARLETSSVKDEGVLQSTTDAMFLGTVQSVTIRYTYEASIGIDLKKVEMKVEGNTITFLLPDAEIIADSLTPVQIETNDFWYPLTDERRMKLLDDERELCRKRCLEEYAQSPEAWDNTVTE